VSFLSSEKKKDIYCCMEKAAASNSSFFCTREFPLRKEKDTIYCCMEKDDASNSRLHHPVITEGRPDFLYLPGACWPFVFSSALPFLTLWNVYNSSMVPYSHHDIPNHEKLKRMHNREEQIIILSFITNSINNWNCIYCLPWSLRLISVTSLLRPLWIKG